MQAGSDIEVVQTTGQSASDVMSQKAVTDNILDSSLIDLSGYARNVKYITSNNVWAAGAGSKNRSINVSVKAGEKYEIDADTTNGSIYAFLKSNTSVGTAVDFSASLNHRVVLSAGQKEFITIPDDTTILYLFANANTSANFLPNLYIYKDKGKYETGEKVSSISLVNTIETTLTDDEAKKTLPTLFAVEKAVGISKNIDLSNPTLNNKYISSDNVWVASTNTNKSTNISVQAGEVYKIKGNTNNGSIYAFLKSDTTVETAVDFSASLNHRVVLTAGQEVVVTIPDDTTILYLFAHTFASYNFLPTLTQLYELGQIIESISKPVFRHGVMMGDSITAGVYSYFNNSERWNGVQVSDGVSDFLANILKCPIDNLGKRGTGYVADTRNLNNAWEQAQVTDFSQYDLIVMMYGVNDYIQGCPLGSIADNAEGTVAGNMIRVLNKIFTDNPLCKVLCVSSYNTWGQVSQGGDYTSDVYYGDLSTDYGLGYAISGNTLQDHIELQMQVCEHYHIQYLCLAYEGIVNTFNIKNVLVDGLHPTLESREYIAQEISQKLA
jgi:lysophospholipase L1-like esterase